MLPRRISLFSKRSPLQGRSVPYVLQNYSTQLAIIHFIILLFPYCTVNLTANGLAATGALCVGHIFCFFVRIPMVGLEGKLGVCDRALRKIRTNPGNMDDL